MIVQRITDKLLHLTEDKAMEAKALVTCANCGLSFHAANTDKEAQAEFEREFPGERYDPNEVDVLCGPCYEKFMALMRNTSLNN